MAPELTEPGRAVLAGKPNLRVVVDPWLGRPPVPDVEIRSAGGGVLATTADTAADRPDGWSVVTTRAPTPREAADLDLAWRLVRHVRSNAIVLVKDGSLVGVGAGQMSRVDSARLAVEKAGRGAGARARSARRTPSSPSPTAWRPAWRAGSPPSSSPAGRCGTRRSWPPPNGPVRPWCTTGVRHFRH